MSLFQRNALRPINSQNGNANQLKPNNTLKNALGLSNIGNQANIAVLKQQAARDMSAKPVTSKIPVFRPRLGPVVAASQKENTVPRTTATEAKSGSLGKPKAIVKPKTPVVAVKPVVKPLIENIDGDYNCFLLSDYAADIYQYLREVELKQSLEPNFLSLKGTVMPHMRAILINWLINVHETFKLAPETLYICVSIIDRYFAREAVAKGRIQLVGVTALFIASKYEEIYYPEVHEFVNICDKLYTKRDIINMELEILSKLNFELGRPLPLHFLRRGSKAAKADGRTHMLAKYLCELTLTDYDCAHWHPSQLAATALYMSLRLLDLERNGSLTSLDTDTIWTPTLEHYTGYKRAEVLKHAAILCRTIVNSETSKYQQCRKKYMAVKYMEISKAHILQHKLVKRLASSVSPQPK